LARYRGPVCRLCRSEGRKLYLKGDRCDSPKCAIEKRNFPPGQHGRNRKKSSEYAIQLREKQKVRRMYGLLEKGFYRYYEKAQHRKGNTGELLLQSLELRFDNIVYRSGLIPSRKEARQLILHGHFLLNGRKVNISSHTIGVGDEITVLEGSTGAIRAIFENRVSKAQAPLWLEVNEQQMAIKVRALPQREDFDPTIQEQLIIEYYSR
jgi:small subunit ribosomal protein S4